VSRLCNLLQHARAMLLIPMCRESPIERLLRSWDYGHDGTVDAYALKEVRMSSECLVSLTNGLRNMRRVHEIARITVIRYWYDLS